MTCLPWLYLTFFVRHKNFHYIWRGIADLTVRTLYILITYHNDLSWKSKI